MSALKTLAFGFLSLLTTLTASRAQTVVLTNDDGWAVAQIRAQFNELGAAGFDVVLSAPAQDQSGTGSMSTTPTPLTEPCEFNSCPTGSPAEGYNATSPRLNYVNAYPVDSVNYGIQTLAPQFFGGSPTLVVSGPNIGHNTEFSVFGSGTINAAFAAANAGIPAIAFSGTNTAHEAWSDLTDDPNSPSITNATSNAALAVKLVNALVAQPPNTPPLLPSGVILNVNFPSLGESCTVDDVQFVLTRIFPALLPLDVNTCNNGGKLPTENTVVNGGCFASVSVVNSSTKLDVLEPTQKDVLDRLSKLGLACFSQ